MHFYGFHCDPYLYLVLHARLWLCFHSYMQVAVTTKHIYLNWLEQLEKYGDNVRRIVPCTVPMVCYRPICRKVVSIGAATAAGWRQGAGFLD